MKTSILLVDDDEDDRMFFQEAIEEIDTDIYLKSVNNGLEAIEYLEASTTLPNAIFLDINMPILDGHKCLKQLRSNINYDTIVVFMYSTSKVPNTITQLQKDGADFYIQKPVSFNKLMLLIEKALNLLPQITAVNKHEINFLITNENE